MLFGTRSEKLRRQVEDAEALLKQQEQQSDRYNSRDNDQQLPRQLRQSRHRRPLPEHLQGKHPQQYLRHYHGVLQADAFAGYDQLFSTERDGVPLTEAACWAHARRKIHDVYISIQTATAEEALKRIGELY
ncbi:transposase C of IS166 homeodomain protein, partial [Candidatus Erwinia dacicola]